MYSALLDFPTAFDQPIRKKTGSSEDDSLLVVSLQVGKKVFLLI